jgi:hypothetical protein
VPPLQLSALTNVRRLCVRASGVRGHGYELLRGLPTLRALKLLDADEIPACLSSLVSLESLVSKSTVNYIDLDPLAAALPSLSLTQLVLLDGSPEVFAALPSQTRLRDFCSWQRSEDFYTISEAGLVGGAWLHGLRRLGLSAALLEASMPALAHATCLETAQVVNVEHVRQLEAALGWAVQRPSLRRFDLCSLYSERDGGLYSADWNVMLRAQALRPDLRMRILQPDSLWDMTEQLAADDED